MFLRLTMSNSHRKTPLGYAYHWLWKSINFVIRIIYDLVAWLAIYAFYLMFDTHIFFSKNKGKKIMWCLIIPLIWCVIGWEKDRHQYAFKTFICTSCLICYIFFFFIFLRDLLNELKLHNMDKCHVSTTS